MGPIEEAIGEVLAEQAADLRARYPELYARVDTILAGPRQERSYDTGSLTDEQYWQRRRECAWCGDVFFAPHAFAVRQCCDRECAAAYRSWSHRRAS